MTDKFYRNCAIGKLLEQCLSLYFFSVKAFFRKIRYSLATELTVLFCSLVVIGVTFYIFNDFINVEVGALSQNMRDFFASVVSVVILFVFALLAGQGIRKEKSRLDSFLGLGLHLGENPKVIRYFLRLRIATILLFTHGLGWYVVLTFFSKWDLVVIVPTEGLMLFITSLFKERKVKEDKSSSLEKKEEPHNFDDSRRFKHLLIIMVRRRLDQIFFQNRQTQLTLLGAGGVLFLFFYAVANGVPYFVTIFLSFLSGTFVSAMLAIQVKDDLQISWAEKSFGISHQDFMNVYFLISLLLSLGWGILVCSVYVAAKCYFLENLTISEDLVFGALKIFVINAVPILIMPLLFFQIDPRRPVLQVILVFVIGLFLSTAIYAHWLGVLLLPLFKYYADQGQKDRFYRA